MPPDAGLGAREAPSPGRSRSRARRLARRAAVAVVLVLSVLAGGLLLAEYSLYRQVDKVDTDLTVLGRRPVDEAANGGAVDVAVIGTAGGRWVSQMLLHIDANRRSATFVSVPDSRMRVLSRWHLSMPFPPSGHEVTRVAARIERATGHRLDHVAILDWRAVAQLIDRLGGIDANFGPQGADARWPEYLPVTGKLVEQLVEVDGCHTGKDAARAELKRIHRQQVLLDTVLDQALHQELVYHPVAIYRDLDTLAENLAIDAGWSQRELIGLVVSLRHLRSHAITFETAPGLAARRGAARAAEC